MVTITFENVSFKIKDLFILKNISFTIEDRTYTTLVGPTGAGKTTLINLIAGLLKPTSGKILFDGRDVSKIPPNERHCGMMFESYALFPHLNVLDNVSYAQHMQTNAHQETYLLSKEVLSLVHLKERDHALPKELSGGMQQRVALARALMALEAGGVLILDEPFKALDAGLRMNLRREVKKIAKSKELNLTTIHVTNDMEEAMMGEKIIVLNNGKVEQIGTPKEVMYSPNTIFIANFFSTELNAITGKIIRKERAEIGFKEKELEKIIIETQNKDYFYAKTEKKFKIGDEVIFLIRSQYFKARHKKREDKTNTMVGKVKQIKYMGAWVRIELEIPCLLNNNQTKIIKLEIPTTRNVIHNFKVGETITAYFPSEYVIVFSKNDLNLKELLVVH